ncbi:MAG: hypothetical protein ABS84_14850 [Rubrivivax sp. SCN 71-131]|nr:MAG: hypothetical protein ABS84_14850 [Rubrivivax sp. SCN 71-131]
MAHLGTITKQPSEKLPFDVSYADVLGMRSGTVGTPTTAISGANPPTISDTSLSGSTFQFYIAGGADGGAHVITITTDITVGGKVETVQDEISVVIEEIN